MYCPKCGGKIEDGGRFCPYCGAPVQTQLPKKSVKKKRRKEKKPREWNLLLIVPLAIVLVGAAVTGLLLWQPWNGGKPVKVESVEDILEYLEEQGAACGYENAFAELSELHTTQVDELSYSRFQQHYEGIPVYGQTVVCALGAEGEILSVTGNVADVNEELSLKPKLREEQAVAAISAYLAADIGQEVTAVDFGGLSEDKLCIYSLNDLPDTLAYNLAVEFTVDEVTYGCQMVVDAQTGQIISMDASSGLQGNLNGRQSGYTDVTYEEENGEYFLRDSSRRIYVYASKNEKKYLFFDCHVGDEEISWTANSSPNEDAVDAYVNVVTAYDYFAEVLECYGPTGDNNVDSDGGTDNIKGCSTHVSVGYVGLDYVGLAYTGTNRENCANGKAAVITIGVGKKDSLPVSAYLDTTAHEYAHAVEKWHCGLETGDCESGAISEAFADIFGELIASRKTGEDPDWEISNTSRNIRNPEPGKYCSHVADETGMMSDVFVGWNYAHSTIISHAAHLMWASNLINEEQLAHLWYNAMLMMPTDCSFYECRELVELAARHLKFTEEQQTMIDDAFDQVGIETDDEVKELEIQPRGTLNVLDFADDPYDNYTLKFWRVNGYDEGRTPDLFLLEREPLVEKEIRDEDGFRIPYKEGVYLLVATDDEEGSSEEIKHYLCVTEQKNAKDCLEIPSDFGTAKIYGKVTMEETGEPVAGATVIISTSDDFYSEKAEGMVTGASYSCTTDEKGAYSIDKLPPATYNIHVEHEGSTSDTVTLVYDKEQESAESGERMLERENQIDLELVYQGVSVWILTEVESMGSPQIYYYNDDYILSEIVEYYIEGGDEWRRWKYSFDSNGNVSELLVNWNGKPSSKYSYTYDKSGNLISARMYWFEENVFQLQSQYEYLYDATGNCNEIHINQYSDDEIKYSYVSKCTYDASGNRICEMRYASSGVLIEEHQYKYDAYGNKIEWKIYDRWGNLDRYETYEYDEKGNMVQRTIIIDEETINFSTSYRYDSHDNLIEIYEKKNGEFYSYRAFTYTEVYVQPDQVEAIKAHQQYIIYDME